MICPFISLHSKAIVLGRGVVDTICVEDACGWWDKKQCAILSIAQNLKALNKPPAPIHAEYRQ